MKLARDYVVSLNASNLYWYRNVDNDFIVSFGWNEQYNIWTIKASYFDKLFDIYIGKAPYKALERFGDDSYYTDFFITFRDAYDIEQPLEYKLKVGLNTFVNTTYNDYNYQYIYNVPYIEFGNGSNIAIIDFSFDFINYDSEESINLFSNIALVNGISADTVGINLVDYGQGWNSIRGTSSVGRDIVNATGYYNFWRLNTLVDNGTNLSRYKSNFVPNIYMGRTFIEGSANSYDYHNYGYGWLDYLVGTDEYQYFINTSEENLNSIYSTYTQKGESFNNFMINTSSGNYFVDSRFLQEGNYTFGNGNLWFLSKEEYQSAVFDDNNTNTYIMNIFRGLLKNTTLTDFSEWDEYSIKLLGVNINNGLAIGTDAPTWLLPFNALTNIEIGSGVTILTLFGVAVCFFGVNIFRKLFN